MDKNQKNFCVCILYVRQSSQYINTRMCNHGLTLTQTNETPKATLFRHLPFTLIHKFTWALVVSECVTPFVPSTNSYRSEGFVMVLLTT